MPTADLHAALLEHAVANGDERLAALIVRTLMTRVSPQAARPAARAYRTLVISLRLEDAGPGRG